MFNETHFDIVIVGAGCVGASIASELSRASEWKILLVDEAGIAQKATAQSGGLLRVFHQSEHLTELARESLGIFRAFEEIYGETCDFKETGSLYFMKASEEASVLPRIRALQEEGYPIELLTPKEGEARFPEYDFKDSLAIFEPLAGVADPTRTTRLWVKHAGLNGVRLMMNSMLESLRKTTEGLALETSLGSLTAKVVVLATGAGTVNLLEKLQIPRDLVSKDVEVKQHLGATDKIPGPHFFDFTDLSFAGFKASEDGLRILSSLGEETARLGLEIREKLPELRHADAYTPRREGILHFAEELGGLFIATGWGGTGFKLSPSIGRRAAKLISNYLNQEENHVCFN